MAIRAICGWNDAGFGSQDAELKYALEHGELYGRDNLYLAVNEGGKCLVCSFAPINFVMQKLILEKFLIGPLLFQTLANEIFHPFTTDFLANFPTTLIIFLSV
jgi:hypothetical protein